MIRPMADLPLYLAEMAEMPPPRFGDVRAFLDANDGFRRRVLDRLRAQDRSCRARSPIRRDVVAVERLDTQAQRHADARGARLAGRDCCLGRRGRKRLGICRAVFPAGVTALPAEEARRRRDERWLRALGIARPKFVGEAGAR